MSLVVQYRDARAREDAARLCRLMALRAMNATGHSQREIAAELGISQSAVSQQLKTSADIASVHPELILKAAAQVLVDIARARGFERLSVFGSVARGQARPDSDIDLLVDAPTDATIKDLLDLHDTFQEILGRRVDLITYGGLKVDIDDDIRTEAILL